MADLSIKGFRLLRRSYAGLAAEDVNVKVQAAASVISKATDLKATVSAGKKEVFWMQDPNTGNYIPESHFGVIDVVELREKKLSRKYNP
ncbi:hypothetical protein SLEP1_g6449 [Rubroshorea leprosula]|uniref:Late embryogenesis abundant protein n=1 Tax=Rubroshorea leprosula TaxID=152421 RepID=A0AAV5I187_9ROSI|nr:hypothetical protein SLEP1_g6449 [Rubroshorea leprosula]